MMNKNFAVFIMVHGRPDKMWTYNALRKHGYTGQIFCVADNLDKTVNDYKKKYNKELVVFDKNEAAKKMDSGDNTGDLRSTLFSANTIFEIAKKKNIENFFIMCDDYTNFYYSFNSVDDQNLYAARKKRVKNLDKVFELMVNFYNKTKTTTIAMAQDGDFIGGAQSNVWKKQLARKAMNSFLCSTKRPFKFIGRLNEDVTTYVNLGNKGKLFFTTALLRLTQKVSQKEAGGLTDLYLEYGTYVKSFFSVMYNPSCVKITQMGTYKRIHHRINWNNAVPLIIDEKYKK